MAAGTSTFLSRLTCFMTAKSQCAWWKLPLCRINCAQACDDLSCAAQVVGIAAGLRHKPILELFQR